jgi:enoyl-CoA hydratase
MTMTELVTLGVDESIALLTLNRSDKLNALSYELIDELMRHLDGIEENSAIRAAIITGAGDRAFSAGGDIPQFYESVKQGPESAEKQFVRRGQALTARLESFRKPIIAAVNGLAYGGGCEITEACHLAVASERAVFCKPEIKLGMPPTFGGTQRLPRLAGRKLALELLLTGEPFSAQRAYEIGLVNKVVAHANVLSTARDLAKAITHHSTLAVAGIISAVTRGLNMSIAEGLLVESAQFEKLVPTHDLGEGLNAWVTGRAPNYVGR